VYGSQANLTFTAGATRDITTMVMDGAPTAIDTNLPLFFSEVIRTRQVDNIPLSGYTNVLILQKTFLIV